jgi:glucose/mannose transport system permease protein
MLALDFAPTGTRSTNRRRGSARWIAIYSFLGVFALIYLLPLFVVVANSFRELPEITRNGLIALPHSLSFKAWPQAWAHYCVAGTCEGIKRNFYNSLIMTIPATIASTLLGAINGYVLSKWRCPGSETLFVCIILGVFMPGQIALLPWAYILGSLHLSNSVYGLILVHIIQGLSFTTLFCRNYYVNIPDDLIKAARIDGAGFWRIFYRSSFRSRRRSSSSPSSGSSPASGTNFCSASSSPAGPSNRSPWRWSRWRPVR